MLTRDAIIKKSYTPADLLALVVRCEALDAAISQWWLATLRPGGADYADDERLIAAWRGAK